MKKYLLTLLCAHSLVHAYDDVQAIIFAAGKSTRFNSSTPKLLAPIQGKPMVWYPVQAALKLDLPVTMVVGFKKEAIMQTVSEAFINHTIEFVIQKKQLGTGHALQCTQPHWHKNTVLIMNGDHPLTSPELLTQFIDTHKKVRALFSILTAEAGPDCRYGRITKKEGITRIVEAVDFKDNPEQFPIVNAGFYLIDRSFLEKNINKLWLHTNKNEYYITDLIEIAEQQGVEVNLVQVPFASVYGVNTQQEFARAKKLMKQHCM